MDGSTPYGLVGMNSSGLLIRGFGVRVPGGALRIKALTMGFCPDESCFHIHGGRWCAPCVLRSQSTAWAAGGLNGPGGMWTVARGVGPPAAALMITRSSPVHGCANGQERL